MLKITKTIKGRIPCAPSKSPIVDVNTRLAARMERERKVAASTPTPEQPNKLYPLVEAARVHLRCSPWTIRHMIARGEVRYHRIGRRIYLSDDEIVRLSPETKAGAQLGGHAIATVARPAENSELQPLPTDVQQKLEGWTANADSN